MIGGILSVIPKEQQWELWPVGPETMCRPSTPARDAPTGSSPLNSNIPQSAPSGVGILGVHRGRRIRGVCIRGCETGPGECGQHLLRFVGQVLARSPRN